MVMIAVLIALAVVGHRWSAQLLPKADVTGVAEPGCDLQQRACPAALPQGGRLELSITPRPIPLLQTLNIEVIATGIEARKVAVDLSGATMNMGYNRSELAGRGRGRYAGEISLPVCVSGSMAWVATVIVETDRQTIAVPYRFDTRH